MDLYLHIGTEKTGTTSVQRFFAANRELLKRNGVIYPAAPGGQNHMALTAAALRDKKLGGDIREFFHIKTAEALGAFRRTLEENLGGELRTGTYKCAIMSNEHCSSRLHKEDELEWLRDFLRKFFDRIHIVVYIRRQDEYAVSTYSTMIKSGSTNPLAIPSGPKLDRRYDYWDLLSLWSGVFGRDCVVCRKFEKPSLKNGDIIDDILDVTGLDASLDYERPNRLNESLDAATLEFLRLFNMHVPKMAARQGQDTSRSKIAARLAAISNGPFRTMADGDLAAFMAQFRETNRKVAVEYFGGARTDSDDPLFAPRADERERVAEPTLTVERAVEICAWLWQNEPAQFDRAARRKKKARGRPA